MKRRHFVRAEESSDDEPSTAAPRVRPDDEKAASSLNDSTPSVDSAGFRAAPKAAPRATLTQQPGAAANPVDTVNNTSPQSQCCTENRANAQSGTERSSAEESFAEDSLREDSSSESDSSSDTSSSNSDAGMRPTFVRKTKVTGPTTPATTSRHDAALSMLAQERVALQPIKDLGVDDTDNIDPDAEYAAWKRRQLARQQRDAAAEDEPARTDCAVTDANKRAKRN